MINDFDLLTTCDISGFLKEEIRSIIIYKSDVKDSDIVLDINCGVGEISSEFSKFAQKVYMQSMKAHKLLQLAKRILKSMEISIMLN